MLKITALKYFGRIDLVNLAKVLDVKIEENDKIAITMKKIQNSDSYADACGLYSKRQRGQGVTRKREGKAINKERVKTKGQLQLEQIILKQNAERRSSISSNGSERAPNILLKGITQKF